MKANPVYIAKRNMEKEERFQKDWRLMFEKDNLDEFIRRNSEKIVDDNTDWRHSFNCDSIEERGFYDQRLVSEVWEDMLFRCQDDSVPVTAFDRARLYDLLKERGFSQRNLSRNHRGITLRLPNAMYEFDLKVNNNSVYTGDRFKYGSFAKVTSLREEGFIEFMLRFDGVVPDIVEGMAEGYRKIKASYEEEHRRRKKIKQMVEIATRNRGIDYRIEFEGDSLNLKFERIIYTRIEETVTEDALADFLKALPERMSETVPKVTAGKEIPLELVPISYSHPQSRNSVYKSLVEGTKEDIKIQ